ncbi:MAG: FAD-binding oxidoreductase, partial [Luminiphilus sp.]
MNKATDPTALLGSALIDALGPECLLGEDAKTLFSTDVYGGEIAPALVVRPATQEQAADAVRIAATAGWAITQRGGGMSYTGGYLPTQPNTVMLDLSGLNRIVSINEEDLVITVEAGVTWQQIWEALTPRGLRLPFFGTF